jgi:uncharacterized protein (DUF1499 family)
MTGLQKALAGLALLAGLIAGGVVGVAGIGHKYGAWDLAFAKDTLLYWGFWVAVIAGGAAILVLLLGGIRGKLGGAFTAIIALAVAGGVAYVPWQMREQEKASPVLHDISTDTANPPPFVALAEVRRVAPNGADYPAASASMQKSSYPEIATYRTGANAAALHGKAAQIVKDMGWQLAANLPEEGRIEATAVSEWFGLKDDIVIRIAPTEDGGSILDIRSASREGANDLGANAARIRAFINALR